MKKAIIILIILVIIIFGTLLLLITTQSNNKKVDENLEEQEQDYFYGINNPGLIIQGELPSEVTVENIFFTIEQCIKTYQEYVEKNNKVAIYSLLDYKYINENNIEQSNVEQFIEKYQEGTRKIIQMYQLAGTKYYTYYVKQKIGEEYAYFTVNQDDTNKSFSIVPINQKTYEQKIAEPAKAFGNQEDTIKNNEYNAISYKYYEEEDIADKYLQDYLNNALQNPEEAYATLDEEYRKKKFGDLEGYKQYIEENKERLESMCKALRKDVSEFKDYLEYEQYFRQISKNGLSQYKKEGNTRYILIDTYGAYYIYNLTGIMNYTLILDTYTIDLPEFTTKYVTATDEQKVLLNIQKVFEAINGQDYKYVYNKLDETFKNNNFATLAEFEQYAKTHFFSKNKVVAGKAEKQGNIYLYDITISDATGEDTSTNKKNFVMQLKEGTDFVMSFGI